MASIGRREPQQFKATYQEETMYTVDHNTVRLMTVKEVAYYLKISVSKVYAMANANQIPAVRIGKSWRFRQDMLDAWIQQGCTPSEINAGPPNVV